MMTIYTAITHGRDTLKEQPVIDRAEYIAFTGSSQKSEVWKIHEIDNNPARLEFSAKWYKMFPEKVSDRKFSLWIDGSIEVSPRLDVERLIKKYLSDSDIAVFSHQSRCCAYEEAVHCATRNLDDSGVISKQVFKYTREGYPEKNGLSECCVILRRNTEKMREFSKLWWNEILNGSVRDQISFDYCTWKMGLKVSHFDGTIRFHGNENFTRYR